MHAHKFVQRKIKSQLKNFYKSSTVMTLFAFYKINLIARHEFSYNTNCHLYDWQDETKYKYKANVHTEQLYDEYREFHRYLLKILGPAYIDYLVQHESQYEGKHLEFTFLNQEILNPLFSAQRI